MKKVLFTLIFGFSALFAFAQEPAVYAQYQLFPVLINPGYTGFQDKHEFLLNARRTWAGFPGSPSTYTFMYNGPVGDKLALGGGLFSEKAGSVNTLRLQLNYAFRFRIQKAQIGLGLSTEFLRRNANGDLLEPTPVLDPNDEVLEGAVEGQRFFDASVGAFVMYDERFFAGLSLPNTIRARLDEIPTSNSGGNNTNNNGGLFQFYIFQMGYILNVESQNFKIIPSLALRNVRDVPYQIDFNVQGRFLDDKLIGGLTFRPQSSNSMVTCLIGTKYKGAQLYYSYDVSFGNFQQYNSGSHELSVAFALDRKAPKPAPEATEIYK
ncbi:MAG: PorP/SprF family type IX secretion system membrane protein [Saprospiraceae bacterium]|nr:PorP/SprF family type IX secretion system membrane protein [Saprospiraceae bacterium]